MYIEFRGCRVEIVDDEMVQVLRRKSGPERLQIAFGMMRLARRALTLHLARQHPEWSEGRVTEEVAHRISHGSV